MKFSFITVFSIFVFLFLLVPDTIFAEPKDDKKNDSHLGTIEWIDKCITMISGTSIIRVTDHGMNENSEQIEHFDIDVWSNSENIMKRLTVTETGNDTGIFEVIVFFTTNADETSGNRIKLLSNANDLVFAKYVDETPPKYNT